MTDHNLSNSKPPEEHLLKNVDLKPIHHHHKKGDGNTAFLRAARSGNLEKVLEFINANVDINTSNSNGLNALHLASKDGHTEVVAELLKRGANVDAATKKGNTGLHIASLAGQEEVVKLLIEHSASVNVQSQSGFTPLYMAAQENHEKVVRYLLNHGANQSLATEDGFTPLAVAMQQGHDKVVTELLENDTRGKIRLPALHIAAKKDDCKAAALLLQSEHNPDITSKSGFTPLHIASHYGNDAIASLLLAKGADVNYAAKHNITPLHVAAKWGRNNMVILLLDKGASIIAKTRDGLTPLHCAARSGHEQVVDTLLQRHAPITAKTKNGLAPLHMASQGDHVEAARVLLSHRAPVDDVTVDYLTALHVASHCGHVSVAKLLLDRKADPNARALNGFTPLHIACKKNRVKVVELLLKYGGSIEATTESGLSPLHVASFMGCMNIVIYLLQCEANPDVSTIRGETPLHLASRANQTDIIRILLRNGAQVDAKAREQQTPLHIAARLGNTDIVMLLLQHGANVDSVTKDLYTSLHIAAKEDQEEVAQTLLEHDASMTATTKKGFTPLHLSSKYGRTKIATLLLQRGAPVDAQGKNDVTPLHVASHYDHQGIALLLLDKGASPHATAKNGHTPLHIAAKKNQMDIAAMLLEYGGSADVESKAGFTPLHLAAQEGHVDMTNLLLEHKADINHSSKNGLTPLHLCAQEDCVDVAKILVRNGADANAVTKAGYTPLHIASHFGQLNMVRFLLSQNGKVDATTATGYTPLHQAAQQGNSAIVAVLLDNGASPNTKNNQGLTALYIAQKLGYISVVEVLKNVTKQGKGASPDEEKYKVVAPETMQENFMSDSEDEGGDDATNEQSYRYLTIDEMKSLGDDSMPLDVIKEDRYDTMAGVEESISPQHSYIQLNANPVPDNVDVVRTPVVQTGFLVSFLVDAKGGAMRGCRHSGVRVIVPPQCVTMPTRVTCRYVRRDKPNHPPPPPLMEGEALASRILELGPTGVKFLGPVVIEVPNFAALRGNEREIVILRSDNGETWREHTMDSSAEAARDILSRSFDKDGNQIQIDEPNRITSIVTTDFPHYFAVVSRIRQEVHAIGPEGGMVSSSVVPQVQAVFPPGALTKKIKVGLQAQPIPSELTATVLGNCVAVSPIVTIEPRRRKFHKPITLTLPVPQAANKGMINQYSGDAPTLRLLCSITGGTSRAQWEDVTGSTPLTFVKECVSFTTTVSARFWLMDIRDIAMATKKATELYREAILTPFMVKFVVFAKRIDNNEARLRVFCMTDDKEDKTLECQEHFTEVAKSRDVEVLEGKKQLIELSGNLISVTKSGDQLKLGFSAFHENRLPFTVRIKDSLADPIGRMLFFKEQKPVKTSTPHPPVCVLNIVLPDGLVPDPEYLDSPMRKYSFLNDTQGYHRSNLRLVDISNMIDEDWVLLADKLGVSPADVKVIQSEYPDSVPKQVLTMLRVWQQQSGSRASPNILEDCLISIGRQDIVQECILNMKNKPDVYSNGIMTEIIGDYHSGKKDPTCTDDDEKKYTGEEKAIDEPETKKSVSERKMEIEQRLKSKRSDSEEKKQLPDQEPVAIIKMQNSQQRDVVKNVVHDEDDVIEPTSLTFEQKRLSFERGISLDKIVTEVDHVQVKVEEKPVQISKDKLKTNNKDEPAEVEKEEKRLSFAEKRLSFEQGSVTQPAEVKVQDAKELPKRSAEDKRRDSELLEGVSVGLGKLEVERNEADQCFLSPKLVATPPPSPAEFQKQDSVESNKSSKRVSVEDTGSNENKPKADASAADDGVRRLAKWKRPRVRHTYAHPPAMGARYDKRANSVQDALSINQVSSLTTSAQSSFDSDSNYTRTRTSDQINLASFRKHFAASCLPSCVWNQSLPNLHFSSACTADRRTLTIDVPNSTTLAHASSVEYFTPEKNFVPQCGAYCTWSSAFDDELIEDVLNTPLIRPVNIDIEGQLQQESISVSPLCNLVVKNEETLLINPTVIPVPTKEDHSPLIEQDSLEATVESPAQLVEFSEIETTPAEYSLSFDDNVGAIIEFPQPESNAKHEESIFQVVVDDLQISPPSSSPLISVQQTEYTVEITPTDEISTHTTLINTAPVYEMTHEEGHLSLEEADTLKPVAEPLHVVDDTENAFATPSLITKVYASENEKFAELMNKVFEKNVELEAAGKLKVDSDSEDEIVNNRMIEEAEEPLIKNDELMNGDSSESDTDNANVPVESAEKLHQRKVAFRLNSTDDGLVYPGQTDSEEYTSSGDTEESVESNEKSSDEEEEEEAEIEVPKMEKVEEVKEVNEVVADKKEEPAKVVDLDHIERKFERMASQEECGPHAEGEFHRIVSQLSVEEMDDCLNVWNETHVASGDEKAISREGDIQQHSYTERDTTLSKADDSVAENSTKRDSMDYNSKKKFWQSFESASTESKSIPVAKPRSTTDIKDKTPPIVSKRSIDNISIPTTVINKDKIIKSESEDNVVFATSAATAVPKPTMKQVHSLTAYSTDSEAEYIAACGIEKLAYENVAFSEEEEDRSQEGGVKAKKKLFENMQKELSTSQEESLTSPPLSKSKNIETKLATFEEHIDKSEVESTEKRDTHAEDTEDPSTATPVDIHFTNGCSAEEGADSTQSESDITPEDLKDKQYSLPDLESTSQSSHRRSDSDHSIIGQLEIDVEAPETPKISVKDAKAKFEDKMTTKSESLEKTAEGQVNRSKSIEKTITRVESIEKTTDRKKAIGEKVSLFENKSATEKPKEQASSKTLLKSESVEKTKIQVTTAEKPKTVSKTVVTKTESIEEIVKPTVEVKPMTEKPKEEVFSNTVVTITESVENSKKPAVKVKIIEEKPKEDIILEVVTKDESVSQILAVDDKIVPEKDKKETASKTVVTIVESVKDNEKSIAKPTTLPEVPKGEVVSETVITIVESVEGTKTPAQVSAFESKIAPEKFKEAVPSKAVIRTDECVEEIEKAPVKANVASVKLKGETASETVVTIVESVESKIAPENPKQAAASETVMTIVESIKDKVVLESPKQVAASETVVTIVESVQSQTVPESPKQIVTSDTVVTIVESAQDSSTKGKEASEKPKEEEVICEETKKPTDEDKTVLQKSNEEPPSKTELTNVQFLEETKKLDQSTAAMPKVPIEIEFPQSESSASNQTESTEQVTSKIPTPQILAPSSKNASPEPKTHFSRSSTSESLKSEKSTIESKIPVKRSSVTQEIIKFQTLQDNIESDDSSHSLSKTEDPKATPTRIPIAKGPLNTSQSEIKRKASGERKPSITETEEPKTATKIPISKGPLTTSQSEIILRKSTDDVKAVLADVKSASVDSKIPLLKSSPILKRGSISRQYDYDSTFGESGSSISRLNSRDSFSENGRTPRRSRTESSDFDEVHTSSTKVSFDDTKLVEDLEQIHSHLVLPDDETDISDEQVATYDVSDQRVSITEAEAKVVAEGLVNEIETEINKRPDIVENFLLLHHGDYIRSMSMVDPLDDVSNDITDEDLRSTGTEVDLPENQVFFDRDELHENHPMKISEASPTEYEINFEQVEEFNVLESVDFEEQLTAEIPGDKLKHADSISQDKACRSTSVRPPIPEVRQPFDERKSSEDSFPRNDLMSPESISSSDTPRKYEDVTSGSRSRQSVDGELYSSSSESHYQSLTSGNRTAVDSRPCSSDVEALLSGVLSGTAGSSEYETAVSHDTTSYPSHDFHTAVSSASIHESLKSIDSESSGHLGSAEVSRSSDISETLVPSAAELEHDMDLASTPNAFEDLNCRSPVEPYGQEITLEVVHAAPASNGAAKQLNTSKIAEPVPAQFRSVVDDKLMSSCEDMSSVSANLPTVFEVASNESDRMDNSLISEQSLTMSVISNQLSTSSSDFRDEVDNDSRTVDTNTSIVISQNAQQAPPTSVTLFTSTNQDQERQNVCTQVTSTMEKKSSSPTMSPVDESFEIVETPNFLDDFVVIEGTGKEENKADKPEEEIVTIPRKTTLTLKEVKYFSSGGTPEDGSGTFESVTFEQVKPINDEEPDNELYEHEVEEGKKWIEMQFQTDSEEAAAYEYTYDRVPLEDIKEEDTDEMQSSKVGSIGSQISHSVGSLGSTKQSLSSTPDYDILIGKRINSKPPDPETVSQASLQEFERLEQMISLESMKGKLSGSQDSIASSGGSSGKKRSSDNISVTSLKEFEGLEHACLEAEQIEERAKAEERSLSQIEEGHESQASESESCETLEKSVYDSDEDESNYDQKMFEIDEIIRQAQSNVEQFVDVDRLERTESLGRGDSFEETSRIPDLELDQPLTDAHSSSDVYSGKKYIENVDVSHSLTVSTDSLELKHPKLLEDPMVISTDSLEGKVVKTEDCNTISDRSNVSEKNNDFLHEEIGPQPHRLSLNAISSPDSSSTATHATYENEADSIMSSSVTSGGSNTMILSAENLENIVSNYSNWLDGSQTFRTETKETVAEDKGFSTVHRTVETTKGGGAVRVVYKGPDAKAAMEQAIESFGPAEYSSETQEIDADGNVRIERILGGRMVVVSEQVESTQMFTQEDPTKDEFLSGTQQSGKGQAGSSDKDEQSSRSTEAKEEMTKDQKKKQHLEQ